MQGEHIVSIFMILHSSIVTHKDILHTKIGIEKIDWCKVATVHGKFQSYLAIPSPFPIPIRRWLTTYWHWNFPYQIHLLIDLWNETQSRSQHEPCQHELSYAGGVRACVHDACLCLCLCVCVCNMLWTFKHWYMYIVIIHSAVKKVLAQQTCGVDSMLASIGPTSNQHQMVAEMSDKLIRVWLIVTMTTRCQYSPALE